MVHRKRAVGSSSIRSRATYLAINLTTDGERSRGDARRHHRSRRDHNLAAGNLAFDLSVNCGRFLEIELAGNSDLLAMQDRPALSVVAFLFLQSV